MNRGVWTRSPEGDLIRDTERHLRLKHKPDTLFDHQCVAVLLMLVAAGVDFYTFLCLFNQLSFDNLAFRVAQVTGFMIGADVLPIYLGNVYRRLRQGLSKDKMILYLGLGACLLTFALNITLRIYTIDALQPETTSFHLNVSPEAEAPAMGEQEEAGPDAKDVATTVFACAIPFITSICSFAISYVTSDPLKSRKNRLERLIARKREEIRQLEAIGYEYNCRGDVEAKLFRDDGRRFHAACIRDRATALSACEYVVEKLKEHLAGPSACTVLSAQRISELKEHMDRELAALDPVPESMYNHPISVLPAKNATV